MEYISEKAYKDLLNDWVKIISELNEEDYFNLEEFQKVMVRTWKVISGHPTWQMSTSLMILMTRFSGVVVNEESNAASNLVSAMLDQYIWGSGLHEINGYLAIDRLSDLAGNRLTINVNSFDIRSIIDELIY